jgi:predicted Zn-dependent protease
MEMKGVADILPMVPTGLVVVLPLLPGQAQEADPLLKGDQADHSDLTGLDDDLLSALLAHGLAHGLRDHALETEWIAAGLPRFTPIQEREADRDTCEILARAGMDPMLAWHLRARMAQGLPQPASAHDWAQRHPDPPQARQSIAAFAARVRPLQSNPPVVR